MSIKNGTGMETLLVIHHSDGVRVVEITKDQEALLMDMESQIRSVVDTYEFNDALNAFADINKSIGEWKQFAEHWVNKVVPG